MNTPNRVIRAYHRNKAKELELKVELLSGYDVPAPSKKLEAKHAGTIRRRSRWLCPTSAGLVRTGNDTKTKEPRSDLSPQSPATALD